jgi:hypothetical protein
MQLVLPNNQRPNSGTLESYSVLAPRPVTLTPAEGTGEGVQSARAKDQVMAMTMTMMVYVCTNLMYLLALLSFPNDVSFFLFQSNPIPIPATPAPVPVTPSPVPVPVTQSPMNSGSSGGEGGCRVVSKTWGDIKLTPGNAIMPFVGVEFAFGLGQVDLVVDSCTGGFEACAKTNVQGFDVATLQIGRGKTFMNGPTVVDFSQALENSPTFQGCVHVTESLYLELVRNPVRQAALMMMQFGTSFS